VLDDRGEVAPEVDAAVMPRAASAPAGAGSPTASPPPPAVRA
jgi:hypothetical protein